MTAMNWFSFSFFSFLITYNETMQDHVFLLQIRFREPVLFLFHLVAVGGGRGREGRVRTSARSMKKG